MTRMSPENRLEFIHGSAVNIFGYRKLPAVPGVQKRFHDKQSLRRAAALEAPHQESMSLRTSAHAGVAIRIPRRQKKLAAFRFRGYCKRRENFMSAPSFFLSKSKQRL